MAAIWPVALPPFFASLRATHPADRPCCGISLPRRPPQQLTGGLRLPPRLVIARATPNEPPSGQGEDPPFSLVNLPTWAKWFLGSLAWLIVPAFRRLQKFGDVVEKVDEVVEKVEEYAKKADKIAEELAEELPEGSLKDAVGRVEKASEEIARKAKMADDVLDKVTEIVDELETEDGKGGGGSGSKSSKYS